MEDIVGNVENKVIEKSKSGDKPKGLTRRAGFLRIIMYVAISALLFVCLGYLFQPVSYSWNNYDGPHNFYDEPENTIETVFFGASVMTNGVTPMELYQQYGICAYNLGMEQQPIQASAYWLEEVYRLHGETLKTVFLDVSLLRHEPSNGKSFYRKDLGAMQFSDVKWRATSDYTDGSLNETLSYLVPLFSYHSRWAELVQTDFTKQDYEGKSYLRGYNFTAARNYFGSYTWAQFSVLSSYPDKTVEEQELNTASLYYLRQMIEFCNEHELKLVLMKTPGHSMGSTGYNAVKSVADEYGLDYLDFNFEPLKSEIGYNHSTDSMDGGHMNYYGAQKLTAWIGKYLVEQCGATDVRGDEKYDFMQAELTEYRKNVTDVVALKAETDPADYLSNIMGEKGYTVFVTVKDDGASALTDAQRSTFSNLGLASLSSLGYCDSYLAVIDDGIVICEESETNPGPEEEDEEVIDPETGEPVPEENPNDMTNLTMVDVRESREEEEDEELYLTTEEELSDRTTYSVYSGGSNLGCVASVKLDDTEYASNSRGINIVVYDKELGEVVDTALFDTCTSSTRDSGDLQALLDKAMQGTTDYTTLSSTLQKLYLYNLRCEDERIESDAEQAAGTDGLLTYLDAVTGNERYAVFLSVRDEASCGLGADVRKALRIRKLDKLARLGYRDSYLAIWLGGELVYDMIGHGDTAVSQNGAWFPEISGSSSLRYEVYSAGAEAGDAAYIWINDTQYAENTRGINIVVWDVVTNQLVDVQTFDTYAVQVRLADGGEG